MPGRLVNYFARHHWGIFATFIALGGSAYAAAELPPHSVGTVQLKRGAVTLQKIRPSAQATLRHPRGRAGGDLSGTYPNPIVNPRVLPTATEAYHAESDINPDNAVAVKVPPGDYSASGGCSAINTANTPPESTTPSFGRGISWLTSSDEPAHPNSPPAGTWALVSVPNMGGAYIDGHQFVSAGNAELTNSRVFSLPHGGSIVERCEDASSAPANMSFQEFYLIATRLNALH